MMNSKISIVCLIKDWAIGLVNDLPWDEWRESRVAKTEMLFIAIAAAIINKEIPKNLEIFTENFGGITLPVGDNMYGDLATKPSVLSALKEFNAAEGPQWENIYDRWERQLEQNFPKMSVLVWRGIAMALDLKQ